MKNLILSPNETLEMLGTKEEFEKANDSINEEARTKRFHRNNRKTEQFEKNAILDEEGDDLLEDKLRAEYQEDMAYSENSGD